MKYLHALKNIQQLQFLLISFAPLALKQVGFQPIQNEAIHHRL